MEGPAEATGARGRGAEWLPRVPGLGTAFTAASLAGAVLASGQAHPWAAPATLACGTGMAGLLAARVIAAARAGALRAYLGSPPGWVDALCALVLPLAFLLGLRAPDLWLAGLAWALRPLRRSPGLRYLGRIVLAEADALRSVGALMVAVTVLLAFAIHLAERGTGHDAFDTLPDALWWTVAGLTTNGYMDGAVPQTPAGRVIGTVAMFCSLGFFGLLVGILATGFAAEARRREFLEAWTLVSRVPFLKPLGPEGAAEVAQVLRPRAVPAGTVVIRKGREADCMYLISEGEVRVDLPSGETRLLEAGDFFGEMALLGAERRVATVTSTRPTTLLVLDVADVRRLAARLPALDAILREKAARRGAEAG